MSHVQKFSVCMWWHKINVHLQSECKNNSGNEVIVIHKKWGILSNWDLSLTRGGHLYVPCRSVCDRDQNWIQRSKPFFGADQGDFWTAKINGSRTQGCNFTFDPLKIKCSRASEGNGQAIKHTLLIKSLDHGCKCLHVSDYHLLLVFARFHYTVINSWS